MAEIKQESIEEQVKHSTSKGEEQAIPGTSGEQIGGDIDSDEFDEEYITEYCESVNMPKPMTISRELFYSDKTVTRRYEQLSDKDKSRFNQMKDLAETIKRDTGDYGLIEDLMAQVVAQRFGCMSKDTMALVMRPKGEGLEGGKALERTGGMLKIKKGWGLSQIGLW